MEAMQNDTGSLRVFAIVAFYKVVCILAGVCFAYMGYRLFLADKTKPSGDLKASGGDYALSLRGGAPGIFFSLFGAVVISFTIWKGMEFTDSGPTLANSYNAVALVPTGDSKEGINPYVEDGKTPVTPDKTMNQPYKM